jgi:hypothetical protein
MNNRTNTRTGSGVFSRLIPLALVICAAIISTNCALASPSPLSNGGFEIVDPGNAAQAASWGAYVSGYAIDSSVAHSGMSSARCESAGGNAGYGAVANVTLNQKTPAPIVVSGWSRAQNVSGAPDSDYSIYVDLSYVDGTPLYGQTSAFETGTDDWRMRHVLIIPTKPVQSMRVYALFRKHAGTVWFDDFNVRQLVPDLLFDNQALRAPVLSAAMPGGWFVRDVAAASALVPIHVGRTKLGIRMLDEQTSLAGKVMAADFRNTSPYSRAITIYYIERFNAADTVWWNDVRSAASARAAGDYANLTSVSAGATGHMSLYPFGCATGAGAGRALGVPPWLGPRVYRIELNSRAHLLYVAFDLALTSADDKHGHDTAQVAITRFNVDPKWGFRSAAAIYYALFPNSFVRRAKAEGIWMPFVRPEDVQGLADFDVAFHEGDNSVAADRAQGILSFRYVEPMTYWMAMPSGMPRDYEHALALLRQQALGSDEAGHLAEAVLYSGICDEKGAFNVSFLNTPWCNGALWILDPNPALAHPSGTWTKARLNAEGEPVPGKADEPDGEYLDSLEGWADTLNYRASSLAAAGVPLTFTPYDFRPGLPEWFSVYEDAAHLSRDLHNHGKLAMANAIGLRFNAFGPLFDVLGTEMNCFSATGAWSPEPDADLNLRRVIAYHKPYLELLDTDFTKASHAGIELYMERCMFYGFFPSMFSADAANNVYWSDPKLYNRDRFLFRKYLPVIQALSRAGWEPVTWARSDNSRVWIERYGNADFTVMNSSDSPQSCAIAIDSGRLKPSLRSPVAPKIVDLLSGDSVDAAFAHAEMSLRLTLCPYETRAIAISERR